MLAFDVATQAELDDALATIQVPTSVDGLTGGTISGNTIVEGTLSADTFLQGGQEVCDASGNCVNLVLSQVAGACPDGQAIVAIAEDGTHTCAAIEAVVEPDNLNEISNDLIWNQFVDNFESDASVPISDNNPTGVSDEINVPDIGIAQKLTVNVTITNSDLSTVKVVLFDPNNDEYLLVDGNLEDPNPGSTDPSPWSATFPEPTATLTGDLTSWWDKNAVGAWRLSVIDTGFLNNDTDGELVSWSIQIQTLSNKKVEVQGSLNVTNDLTVEGSISVGSGSDAVDIAGSLNVTENLTVGGTIGDSGGDDTVDVVGDLSIEGDLYVKGNNPLTHHVGAVYRWQVFETHDNSQAGWLLGNSAAFFGGVTPQQWTDQDYRAVHMSADKEVLRTLLSRKGFGGKNAVVIADTLQHYSSTNGQVAIALFRVKNTTAGDITWPVHWYYSCYSGWNERASAAINGVELANHSNCGSNGNQVLNVAIPADRVSTIIFVSTAGSANHFADNNHLRHHVLAFGNNSLELPEGLHYVDDFDTATGGWEQ